MLVQCADFVINLTWTLSITNQGSLLSVLIQAAATGVHRSI